MKSGHEMEWRKASTVEERNLPRRSLVKEKGCCVSTRGTGVVVVVINGVVKVIGGFGVVFGVGMFVVGMFVVLVVDVGGGWSGVGLVVVRGDRRANGL